MTRHTLGVECVERRAAFLKGRLVRRGFAKLACREQ